MNESQRSRTLRLSNGNLKRYDHKHNMWVLSADGGKSWYEDKDTSNGFNGESDSGRAWDQEAGDSFMADAGGMGSAKMNAHYKKYVAWFKINHPGKLPLSFKEWLKWAQNKGFAKKHGLKKQGGSNRPFDGGHWAADSHADETLSGDKTPMPEDDKNTPPKAPVVDAHKKMKKMLAIGLVSVVTIGLIAAIATTPSK